MTLARLAAAIACGRVAVDPSSLLSNHLRVDLDASLTDQDFARPARGNPGSGQDLLEAYALCGLDH